MKKAVSLILALVMCLSLCACGSSQNAGGGAADSKAAEIAAAEALAAKQESACEEADRMLKETAELSAKNIPTTYESEVKVVDGKKLYVGTWDHPVTEVRGNVDGFLEGEIQALRIYIPTLETVFSDCEMYAVINVKMMGQEQCRLIDSRLDSSIADKLN